MLNCRREKLSVNYRDSLLLADGRRCFELEIDLLIGSPSILRTCASNECAKDLKFLTKNFRRKFQKYLSSCPSYGILSYLTSHDTSDGRNLISRTKLIP